jgi:hypothetical protein
MANGVPNVLGGDIDPFSPQPSPGAAALNAPGADDAGAERAARAEYYRTQTEELGRLGKKEEELYAKREQEEEPLRRDYTKALQRQSQISDVATERLLAGQRDLPPAPQFNGPQAQQDAVAWMNLAAGFGAIAGAFSRYHTTTALNAFSGMMTGFAKGQIQAFDNNYKTWQANSDRALEYNARAQREYRAIMDNAKLNIDAKSNLMQMTADKWQDQIMSNAARIRDVSRMTQLMEGQSRFEENLRIRKSEIERHKSQWDQAFQMRVDQVYGSAQDARGIADQIKSYAIPPPTAALQARFPYLRNAMGLVMKETGGSYSAGDYYANNNLKKLASSADLVAMRSALTKQIGMQSALQTFEPLARQAGRTMLALVDKVDPAGNTTFNRWVNAGRQATGDPDVAQFDTAVRQYKTETARILNNPALGGVLSDSARHEADAFAPEGVTASQIKRIVPFVENEMDYRQRLIGSQVQYLDESIKNTASGGPRPTYQAPEPPPLIPAPIVMPSGSTGVPEYEVE